jgi:DNA-directed RNA polymerase subunit beta
MPNPRYFISDFLEIQRISFYELLEKGIIEEFSKRNPITSLNKDIELFFYPEYYKLTIPEYSPRQAIIKSKSYTAKLYLPVQLTYKKSNTIRLKWAYIGNLPLMTKRGHFILNGAPRVIVNQIIRSPGIYYQEKLYETFNQKWSQKPQVSYKRYYADIICLRGTWLRLEIDKDKNIWAQTKKGPKIPIFWFLIAMGLSERVIFNSILEPNRLVQNLVGFFANKTNSVINTNIPKQKTIYPYVKNPSSAWKEIFSLLQKKKFLSVGMIDKEKKITLSKKESSASESTLSKYKNGKLSSTEGPRGILIHKNKENSLNKQNLYASKETNKHKIEKSPSKRDLIEQFKQNNIFIETKIGLSETTIERESNFEDNTGTYSEQGRKWLFNKFMNPRAYDLGKQGRSAVNRKLGLKIDSRQLTLTAQDLLYATDYLIKVEKGLKSLDDIDHLKNRRVRTSGELIQIQIGIAIVRLEKTIREKINKTSIQFNVLEKKVPALERNIPERNILEASQSLDKPINPPRQNPYPPYVGDGKLSRDNHTHRGEAIVPLFNRQTDKIKILTISNLINNKAFNSALREFFGTSPLSQFMDQINPLAEITHKRRLSSMGPGGVTRDTATLAIRGIHPTHYGRICPIETPEGKNTGLVNSMTAYARVNSLGMLESPFYKVYKGIVLKSSGMFFLSAEQEEKTKLAASDLFVTPIGFLPNTNIPVRIAENFTKIHRNTVEYIGVSPIQMISIATSLIPFLEHDDANRALMGSNMQRQAVPLIRADRPIVGTGLEPRAVSDSGHVIQSKFSGVVTYVSAQKIIITTFRD